MKQLLNALYELQSVDLKISKENAVLAALDGAKALKIKLRAARAAADTDEKSLKDYEIELKDSELTLKSIDEKRSSTEKRMYSGSVSNPKELDSLEKEIAFLKSQQSTLDGRVLELYDLVDETKKKAVAARELALKIEKNARHALALEKVERERLEKELIELSAERESALAKITNKQLLSRYETIRKRTNNAVAKVVDGKCEGCHVAITSFTMRRLFDPKEPEYCENCGRLLLLELA